MTKTIQLKTPIEHNGTTYTELTFREATTGDVATAEAVGGGDFMQTLAIVASITGVPLPAIRQISMREFKRLAEEVKDLLGESEESAA
ncbi:phage tail assembly protein [Aerobium aerolatum]|uniref:Phage tail assembly chaperone protein, E, or 41 or 14 n=1 Tax=Aquamicrobium aerolatum DSM 21857 TaxID=1121003 RepID=A0A1I3JGG3_9HYPH|nr:phage tail assembly protein [Aquamicrobium aerolatum]SFI59351.1 Phage tail assembly chaperone protein, E, or 41 or 14 [Aquamicrobium aerolatum DSM 21857]